MSFDLTEAVIRTQAVPIGIQKNRKSRLPLYESLLFTVQLNCGYVEFSVDLNGFLPELNCASAGNRRLFFQSVYHIVVSRNFKSVIQGRKLRIRITARKSGL